MIRPLRRRHRVTVCALAVLLPAAFVVGVAERKAVPVAGSIQPQLSCPPAEFGSVVVTKADIWPGRKIITQVRRDAAGSVAVELVFRDLERPDVLVYWAPGKETKTTDRLPGSARLLGALSMHAPLPVPPDVRGETGRFILYSLADQEVVAASEAFIIQKD